MDTALAAHADTGKQYLITGGAGFIGRNLAKALRLRAVQVHAWDSLVVEPFIEPHAETIVRDIREIRPHDLEDIDTVIHLAALKSVPDSFHRPANVSNNITIDHHMLDVFSRSSSRRIVMASSCEVYGSQTSPSGEADPVDPQSPYAVAKVTTELLASVYRKLGADKQFSIVRLFNIYGPDAGGEAVVPAFMDAARRGEAMAIEGDGSQRRDLTHIDDLCGMLLAVLDDPMLPAVINLGSGETISVLEIAQAVKGIHGSGRMDFHARRQNEIDCFTADMTAFTKRYGAVRRRPIKAGLADVYRQRLALGTGKVDQEAMAGAN